jgi:hypothetical protein
LTTCIVQQQQQQQQQQHQRQGSVNLQAQRK